MTLHLRHTLLRPGILLLLALTSLPLACGPKPPPEGQKVTANPKQAPPPPPVRDVPLDPELRTAAQQELTTALHAGDPVLRVHALEAIRDASLQSRAGDVIAALNDPEPVVRFAAALAAGELKLHAAHDALLALADDHSENVRVAVRFALHQLGDKRLSHDLEHMARDGSPRVRGNVAFVLGMLGEPSALKILQVLRLDPDAAVRQQASEAMWRLGDDEGLKDLIAMTYSKYPDDRMFALLALALPRNPVVRQNVRGNLVIAEPWDEVPLVAARALGMLGSDEGYVIAQKGAASSEFPQRVQAAFAFGAIGRSDAQDILRKLLADGDPNVRTAAATAILQLKPPRG